jgi:hypothetical protein
MRSFIASERTALDEMWQRLSKDYYIDPDLAMMLGESLGSYLYLRWHLECKNQAHHMDIYVEDLLEAALLTHIPRQQILRCWDDIYQAVVPSFRDFVQLSGNLKGVTLILKENQHLLGLVVFT